MTATGQSIGIADRLRTTLIVLAMAESGSIIGLAFFLLSGKFPEALIMIGIALAGSIYYFPTRGWLESEDH